MKNKITHQISLDLKNKTNYRHDARELKRSTPTRSKLKNKFSYALAAGVCIIAMHAHSEEYSPKKQIFAHYMVCCPSAGSDATIDDFKAEIKYAQRMGIDGFSLNAGGWTTSEPIYKKRTMLIYRAAEQLNSNFKLFVSADGKAQNDIEDIIQATKSSSAQLYLNGKPVISTFGGETLDGSGGDSLIAKAKKNDAILIPYFYTRPIAKEQPNSQDARILMKRFDQLEGFFYYGGAGSGQDLAEANSATAKIWKQAGKMYMASVTPFYLGAGKNFRIYESQGFTGMAKQWLAAINSNADWVQIVTWNDWYESSYVAPIDPSKKDTGPKQLPNNNLPPHTAYLAASKYYIDWFKSGHPPEIKQDAIYYFYRLHPKTVKASVQIDPKSDDRDYPRGANNLIDNVYVRAYLKSAASLEITSGANKRRFELDAGVHDVSIPFRTGMQKFKLTRTKKIIWEKEGEQKISEDPEKRFNYFSGGEEIGN